MPHSQPMPDSRAHRGPHPDDPRLFDARALPILREATRDLSFLLGRGYAPDSALKLVGDRYQLTARQRSAVMRSACSDAQAAGRAARCMPPEALRGEILCIDGFNLLTTLEVALSGGVVLVGRDGALRDIAGVHGSYRQVEETAAALARVRELTVQWGVRGCEWYFDQPVSNSGRLCARVRALADEASLPWQASVVADPDAVLIDSPHVAVSADARILDGAARWTNLAGEAVHSRMPHAFVIDLST